MSLEPTAHGEWWVRYGESTFIFRDDSVGLLSRPGSVCRRRWAEAVTEVEKC